MSKLKQPKCPECGQWARHSVEWCPGAAILTIQPDGEWDYAGETDFFYDGQMNEVDLHVTFSKRPAADLEKYILLGCGNHEWESELA